MKISFHGAARTVTGSKHLVQLANGENFLLDCGLFQGLGRDTDSYNAAFGFDAKTVNYVILSHAHIDHTGLLPKLAAEGFRGKIYCTPATKAFKTLPTATFVAHAVQRSTSCLPPLALLVPQAS